MFKRCDAFIDGKLALFQVDTFRPENPANGEVYAEVAPETAVEVPHRSAAGLQGFLQWKLMRSPAARCPLPKNNRPSRERKNDPAP